jgi:murein L,D-transpeptidase YcbB/YkuD
MGSALLQYHRLSALFLLLIFCVLACSSNTTFNEKEIVKSPDKINARAENIIEGSLEDQQDSSVFQDSLTMKNAELVKEIYQKNNYRLLWSSNGVFNKETDSLLKFIKGSLYYGLFPADYYQEKITSLREELQKSPISVKLDASRWSYFDMLSTSAFIQLVKDIKVGRLLPDSVLVKDSSLTSDFFVQQKEAFSRQPIDSFAHSLEPAINDYHQLKFALRHFLPKANLKKFTIIKTKDSLQLPGLVYKRILEEDSLKLKPVKNPDSTTISKTVAKYQKWKKLKVDGKISTALVDKLNETDLEKFLRVAITLDKYKMLPKLPEEYIWVNLPAYTMELRQGDSVVLKSKIICGKPTTRTPQLTSAISDMITYPQWTIPPGIIKKEVLPGLQRDAGYIKRKGFSLVDDKGNEINPYSVNWAKYKNAIPYRVVQGSGDDNALGVIKFNFSNPYAVYLHDTNQRYLFGKTARALSHGCVRVQQWKELANYLLQRDKMMDSIKAVPVDSLNSWLAAKKKRYIKVQQPLPLFIRYFSVEGKNGKLILHDDVYEEDKRIREKIFASK